MTDQKPPQQKSPVKPPQQAQPFQPATAVVKVGSPPATSPLTAPSAFKRGTIVRSATELSTAGSLRQGASSLSTKSPRSQGSSPPGAPIPGTSTSLPITPAGASTAGTSPVQPSPLASFSDMPPPPQTTAPRPDEQQPQHPRQRKLLISPARVALAQFPAQDSSPSGTSALGTASAALSSSSAAAPLASAPPSSQAPRPPQAPSPVAPPASGQAAPSASGQAAGDTLAETPSNLMYSEREGEILQDILYFLVTKFPEALADMFEKVSKDRLEDFLSSIVTMTFGRSATLTLLRYMIQEEFKTHSGTSDASNVLFRENSVVSRILKAYLQKVGEVFLREVLSEVVTDVCIREQKISYEVDPAKLEDEEECEHNRELLLSKVDLFVKRITSQTTVNKMPQGIRVIAAYFNEFSKLHCPEKSTDAIVGSFLMLRYINPAIMSPEVHALIPPNKTLSAKARRNLLLITKVLQNMSNGVPFSKKETYMVPLNAWVESNTPRLQRYYHDVIAAASTCSANLVIDSDICIVSVNDLHMLHQMLFNHRDEVMAKISDDESKREFANKLEALGTYSRKISFANALDTAEQAHVRQVLTKYREEAIFVSWFEANSKKKKKPSRCILVVGLNRIFLVRRKPPVVPGGSLVKLEGHVLDILEIRSPTLRELAIVFRVPGSGGSLAASAASPDKTLEIAGESDQADELITCIRRAFLTNFSCVPRESVFKVTLQPPTRTVEDVVVPGTGPCGGFAGTYKSLCNYHGCAVNNSLVWDIENLFAINTSFNLAQFFSADSADSDLVPVFHALRYNTHFRIIVDDDACKIRGPQAVGALCDMLRCNTSLTSVTLASVGLSDKAFASVFDAMAANPRCQVFHLNLHDNELDEKSCTSLGRYCTELAARSGLISLNLQNAIQNPRALAALSAELIKAAKAGPASIQALDISRNKIGEAAGELGQWFAVGGAAIRKLNIGGTMLSGTKLTSFLQAVSKGCRSLEVIDLSNLKFAKQEDMLFVSQLLFLTTSLREVNLSGSVPTIGALQDLLSSGKPDASIHANLSCNNFSGDGGKFLHDTMPKMKSITSLDLSDTDLGDDGLFHIAEGLTLNTGLRFLNVNGCFRTDRRPRVDTIRALCKLVSSDCPLETLLMAGGPRTGQQLRQFLPPLFQSLIANKSLTKLDISWHHFGNSGAIALSKALQLNNQLTDLQVDQNEIGFTGLSALAEALKENKTIQLLPLPVVDIGYLLSGANSEVQKKIRALCLSIESSIALNNGR